MIVWLRFYYLMNPEETGSDSSAETVSMSYEEYLIYSARYGDMDGVRQMLMEKVKANCRDKEKCTALRKRLSLIDMAAANGFVEIGVALITAGADPNAQNNSGNTPMRRSFFIIDWAALNGHKEMVLCLLDAKAEPNMKNEYGRRALDEALKNGHSEIIVRERTRVGDTGGEDEAGLGERRGGGDEANRVG